MHPIERLRYVARADGAGVTNLVEAAARALAGLDDDHAALVTGCRQMVDRHPTVGPMWWLTSRMLCGDDPRREAWGVVEALDADPTPRQLAAVLPEEAVLVVLGWPELTAQALHRRGDIRVRAVDALGEGGPLADTLSEAGLDAVDVPEPGLGAAVADADGVVLEALAVGPDGLVAVAGSRAAAAVARHAGKRVWVVSGEGRMLPARVWETLLGRLDGRGEPWDAAEEVVPLDLVDAVVGPWGTSPPAEAVAHSACPVAAELAKGVYAPGTYHSPPDEARNRRGRGWR
ncbi:MAG TPA: hypothetical protein VGI06_04515 [Acidimicrobiales bacterium]